MTDPLAQLVVSKEEIDLLKKNGITFKEQSAALAKVKFSLSRRLMDAESFKLPEQYIFGLKDSLKLVQVVERQLTAPSPDKEESNE